jgi:predicted nucleic acid-binding Zn finger protein
MPFYSSFNVFTPGNFKEVLGSKGAKYIVNLDDNTCTCPGYTYRGDCKHIKELETA